MVMFVLIASWDWAEGRGVELGLIGVSHRKSPVSRELPGVVGGDQAGSGIPRGEGGRHMSRSDARSDQVTHNSLPCLMF